jgi:predicted ATPase
MEPKKTDYSIFLSLDQEPPIEFENPFIWIYPSNSSWNDFGLQTECWIKIFENKKVIFRQKARIAFVEKKGSPFKELSAILQERSSSYLEGEHLPIFFTLLGEMQDYRNIVSQLGLEKANKILSQLNDLALIKQTEKNLPWLEKAYSSKQFNDSFIRNSEMFFAFNNAGHILNGLEEERLDTISERLELSFKLDGFENSHFLNFNFDLKSIIPKRICVVIGKNGVGKSQSLSKLVSAALIGDTEIFRDEQKQRPMISRILAMSTPGETAHTFPTIRKGTKHKILYRRLRLSRGSTGTSAVGIADLLTQLSRTRESIAGKTRWDLFMNSIDKVFQINDIAIPLKKIDLFDSDENTEIEEVTFNFPDINAASLDDFVDGNESRILHLRPRLDLKKDPLILANGKAHPMSSGQISFFRFALQACLYIENGTLVLIDEPETHLHPNLISDFVEILDEILLLTGSIAIIATHSAYFVREVPRSQVNVLNDKIVNKQKFISCEQPRLKTFGADIGAISHFVFGDNFRNALLDKVIEKLKGENNLEQLENELSTEMIMALRREISEAGIP